MADTMIRFLCPKCGKRLKAASESAGHVVACGSCGERVTVPLDATVPKTSQAPSKHNATTSRRRRTLWAGLAIAGALVMIAFFAMMLFADSNTQNSFLVTIGSVGSFVMVVGGIVGIGLLVWGGMTKCPKCGKFWASVFLRKTVLETKKCFGLVTRYSHSRSTGHMSGTSHNSGSPHQTTHNSNINTSGSTKWKERVPVIRTRYGLYYECKYCHGQWSKEQIEQVEDFN